MPDVNPADPDSEIFVKTRNYPKTMNSSRAGHKAAQQELNMICLFYLIISHYFFDFNPAIMLHPEKWILYYINIKSYIGENNEKYISPPVFYRS